MGTTGTTLFVPFHPKGFQKAKGEYILIRNRSCRLQAKEEQHMKKAFGRIVLILVLMAGVALAGESFPAGNYPVTILQTNTAFEGDTTLRINSSVMEGEQSITCEGTLTFTVEGDSFLVLDNAHGAAVTAKEILLKKGAPNTSTFK